MHTKNIRIIIILTAELIVAITAYLHHYSLEKTTYTLVIVLMIFFAIGSFVQNIFLKVLESEEFIIEHKIEELEDEELETEELEEDKKSAE